MGNHRYIYRLKARTAGASPVWWVSIDNAGGKQSHRFRDCEYGGTEQALAAAIAKRDELVQSLGIEERLAKPNSPHPGVSRTESENRRDGYPRLQAYWQAYWPKPDGTQATKRFSVQKHGEEGAKQLAINVREQALAALNRGDDPFFELPEGGSALWRYMDFTKFLALLEDSCLFFSEASNFDDPFEGAYAQGNRLKRKFILSRATNSSQPPENQPPPNLAISCWYAAKHESAAMWSLYAKSTDAVAIRTTVRKLRDSLPPRAKMGLVKYIDYTQSWIPESEPVHRYFHKRLSFQHENEFRAVLDKDDVQNLLLTRTVENGLKVPVELNRLVDKVYVAPRSSTWFVDLVVSVCRRYGLKAVPSRSSLYDDPVL